MTGGAALGTTTTCAPGASRVMSCASAFVNACSTAARLQLRDMSRKALDGFHASCGGTPPRSKHIGFQARANIDGFLLTANFDRVDILPNGTYNIVSFEYLQFLKNV